MNHFLGPLRIPADWHPLYVYGARGYMCAVKTGYVMTGVAMCNVFLCHMQGVMCDASLCHMQCVMCDVSLCHMHGAVCKSLSHARCCV